jgi:aspartate kinase
LRVVVHKYGGSSVKEVERLHKVALHVAEAHKRGDGVVVVVSAMGNTTNELIELARQVTETPKRRELDMLVSVGERISMSLLSMAIDALGVPAESFTGSQSGIITDESHTNAKVIEVRPARIERALAQGKVAIVAGFQGVSRDREVTTLGRGGSDTTAVALAAALKADWCEIHSDVPGLFSADPRKVPKAIKLDEISLEEALLMSAGGAKVLHEAALTYAIKHGISLVSSNADGSEVGTRVTPRIAVAEPTRCVRAITEDSNLEIIQLIDNCPTPFKTMRSLLTALAKASAPIKMATSSRVLVSLRDWPDREGFELPTGTESLGEIVRVSAVGMGIGNESGLFCTALDALEEADVSTTMWAVTSNSIGFEVRPSQSRQAQQALHAKLIESGK